jgi:hypothetical protein
VDGWFYHDTPPIKLTATIVMDNSGWVVLVLLVEYHDKTTHPLLSINIVAVCFIGGVT